MLLWIIICHLVVTSMKFVRNLHSPLDYCNCLLYGIPKYQRDKLQRIQNTAARLVMGLKRSDHVKLCNAILTILHWFPVEKRIEFKILLITYKNIHGQSADYQKPLIEMYQLSRTLRSASRSLLCPQKAKTENYGCRAFSFMAPK